MITLEEHFLSWADAKGVDAAGIDLWREAYFAGAAAGCLIVSPRLGEDELVEAIKGAGVMPDGSALLARKAGKK